MDAGLCESVADSMGRQVLLDERDVLASRRFNHRYGVLLTWNERRPLAVKLHHERGGLWTTDLTRDETPRFPLPALGAGPVLVGEAGAETVAELAAAMDGWDPDDVGARLAGGKRCFTA